MPSADLFGAWPKHRSELPLAYQQVYVGHMESNRSGGTPLNKAALWLEGWMHRQVARPPGRNILELGAGNLNHVALEDATAAYAAIEPLEHVIGPALVRINRPVTYLGGYGDLLTLPGVSSTRYDKVISVAVLEHLEDLPAVVAASALLLDDEGVFAAGVPSEGGRLWEAAWRASTGRAFRREHGLDYAALMAWEHINTVREIEAVIQALFAKVRITRFPGPTVDSSLYTAIFAQLPRQDAATGVLESRL